MMDKLILQCGRYYLPAQTDDAGRLHRLENYVATFSAEAEALFETCERLRREIARHMADLDERVAALSAADTATAVLSETVADGEQDSGPMDS